jgi:hypothetical protein
MKTIMGNKTIGFINIYIYLKISQGNSMSSYLYLKQAKYVMFLFLCFLFFLRQNQRIEGQNKSAQEEGLAPVGVGRYQGKGIGG